MQYPILAIMQGRCDRREKQIATGSIDPWIRPFDFVAVGNGTGRGIPERIARKSIAFPEPRMEGGMGQRKRTFERTQIARFGVLRNDRIHHFIDSGPLAAIPVDPIDPAITGAKYE